MALSSSLRCVGWVGLTAWLLAGCTDEDGTLVDHPEPAPTPPVTDPPPVKPPAKPPAKPPSKPHQPRDAGTLIPTGPGALTCDPASGTSGSVQLTPIAGGLNKPLFVTAAPGDDQRLFVLEQAGVIRIIKDGELLGEPFLDISERVATYVGEDGLLGLAFHPDYANNGRFFIHYSTEQVGSPPASADESLDGGAGDGEAVDAGLDASIDEPSVDVVDAAVADAGLFIPASSSVISEFSRGADPEHADPSSERRLLAVQQRWTNHNAGMLEFRPGDGLLYISFGDGDRIGDPFHEAQNLSTVTGKLLRIDVDSQSDGLPYGIPPGNMTGDGVRPELWSYGFRNPWRFSFDPCTNDLYIGDVGQGSMEEIDYQPGDATAGRNYGWNTMEGTLCYDPNTGCDKTGIQMPVLTYRHTSGCSVTSGYVYRGSRIPWLRGAYLYGDYCANTFAMFRIRDGAATEQTDLTADLNPTLISKFNSFGVDNAGEIYAVSGEGTVYRIDPE